MEGITVSACKSVKGYWVRRGYQRLNGWGSKRRMPTVQLGSEGSGPNSVPKQRRFWRMKRLKVKLRRFSPKKFLLGLRDAYVNFMNRMAGSRFISTGIAGYGVGDGFNGLGARPLKEYDERMIIQIYKSLVLAQSQMVAPAAVSVTAIPPRNPPLATIAEC